MAGPIETEKQVYRRVLAQLAGLQGPAVQRVLQPLYDTNVQWHGSYPHGDCEGLDAVVARFWLPLVRACPNLERQDDIVLSGLFEGARWVASTGHYVGTFVEEWLGIPPTGRVLNVRVGEFSRFSNGKIVEAYVIVDLVDVLRQAGIHPLRPALGLEDRVPAPATQDGFESADADDQTAQSLELVEQMIRGLMEYDGTGLASMRMERFWHPRMMWYGPGGIGTTRGLDGFQRQHQAPFLRAFPDRKGGNHKARFAEGAYVASTGWPSVRATHAGDGWLGLPASGTRVGMRVMDFWRREGPWLVENWVFIDMADLLAQMGHVDLMQCVTPP
ncbi:MAG: ester cyclase [Vicinamibacterales bacterium]